MTLEIIRDLADEFPAFITERPIDCLFVKSKNTIPERVDVVCWTFKLEAITSNITFFEIIVVSLVTVKGLVNISVVMNQEP